ncbi:MAG: LytTR family DNA-binding domain-containing protein [Ruminiclostridium sp.]
MKIQINEDSSFDDTEIIINCKQMNDAILKIVAMFRVLDLKLTGMKDNQTYILDVSKIMYIDTVDKRTYFYTDTNVYETPLKLYELEEQLEASEFFRAGKSTIINFNYIKALKPDIDGKVLVTMTNGEKLFVSRQYAVTIKKKLGMIK